MSWLIELFFGKWECVLFKLVSDKSGWLIVCHKHSVTGRTKGYVDMNGKRPLYILEQDVVDGHIKEYSK